MKRFQLLKLLPIVAVVFAAACTDATTGPATASRTLTPGGPSLARGNEPPPPVDAVVVVCTSSGCVAADGTYFANGSGAAALTAQISPYALGQGECALPGPARLLFSQKQPTQGVEFAISANAQIRCSHERASGNGTIEIEGVVVRLDQVLFFDNPPVCTEFCGSFTATTEPAGLAHGFVFDRAFYDDVFCVAEGEGERPICTPEG